MIRPAAPVARMVTGTPAGAVAADAEWLRTVLERASRGFGSWAEIQPDGLLVLGAGRVMNRESAAAHLVPAARLAGVQPGVQHDEPQLIGGHHADHLAVFDDDREHLAAQQQQAQ